MSSFILILICMSLGFFLVRMNIFTKDAAFILNKFIIYIPLPALTLKSMHQVSVSKEGIYAISMSWILFVIGFLFFTAANRLLQFDKKTKGCLILTSSLGNTSFVGFPLLEALIGTSALSVGVLVDQPGTFTVASSLGILVASTHASGIFSKAKILQKILLFPPFIAMIFAIATQSIYFSADFMTVLERLASTLAPLSLFAVGMQLNIKTAHIKQNIIPLCTGLIFKLLLAPIFFVLLFKIILNMNNQYIEIIILESAMAPMITAGIIATEYGLNSELANLMIGIGIPISLVTVPIWHYFLK